MAAFGVAGSVAGIISLGITVCQGLVDYYGAYKDYNDDIDHFCRNVTSLHGDLSILRSVEISANRQDETHLQVKERIASCEEGLRRLDHRLQKVRKDPTTTKSLRGVALRATYPFRRSTLLKHREIVDDLQDTLHHALQTFITSYSIQSNHVLGLVDNQVQAVVQKVDDIRATVTSVRIDSTIQKVLKWLSAPDPSTNYNTAIEKRHPKTGLWFINGLEFRDWKTKSKSFLWLHGIPGSGKTVLSSAALQNLLSENRKDEKLAVVYFYFSFNDREKQSAENCILSLLSQLGSRTENGRDQLQELHKRCSNGTARPSLPTLLRALKNLIESYDSTRIVIDALDECRTRPVLLVFLRNILDWNIDKLHVLATSRNERDIAEFFDTPLIDKVSIQNKLVDVDIGIHVLDVLEHDERLKSLPNQTKDKIHNTLLEGAGGMFQWAVCQLDGLRLCESNAAIKRALGSLPNTLEETYMRMLQKIDRAHYRQAYRVLQWLVFSARPINAAEAIEAVAMQGSNGCQLDPDERLHSPRALLSMCGDLVDLEHDPHQDMLKRELKLTHFSIKEYLVSTQARNDHGLSYMIEERETHEDIARLCVSYLSTVSETTISESTLKDYPLALYAANHWIHHFLAYPSKQSDSGSDLWKEVLGSERRLTGWLRLMDPDYPNRKSLLQKGVEKISSPLYYASLCGMKHAVEDLLHSTDLQLQEPGRYGTALQAAAHNGHVQIVRALLDAGADPNTNNGFYGCALQAACFYGSEEIVRILVEAGAELELRGPTYHCPLLAAAYKGHADIARYLIGKGAEVNVYTATKPHHRSPLYAAAFQGYEDCVKVLLDSGAEKDDSKGYYGSALGAAASRGHEGTLRLLGRYGVDLDVRGQYGTPLETAIRKGERGAVQILEELKRDRAAAH